MTQEDITRMAREAGLGASLCHNSIDGDRIWIEGADWHDEVERFAAIVAAAQREKVAAWMRSMGYATGHGDTVEDLLDHFGTQIAEGLLMEREACAKVCDAAAKKMDDEGEGPTGYISWVYDCATAIRARSKT